MAQNPHAYPILKVADLFFIGLILLVIPWYLRNQVVHGPVHPLGSGRLHLSELVHRQTLAAARFSAAMNGCSIIARFTQPTEVQPGCGPSIPDGFPEGTGARHPAHPAGHRIPDLGKVWGNVETGSTGCFRHLSTRGMPIRGDTRPGTADGKIPGCSAALYALVYDIVLFGAVLVGLWCSVRFYRSELVFDLAGILVLTLFYLLIIPGPAGESASPCPCRAAAGAGSRAGIPAQEENERGIPPLRGMRAGGDIYSSCWVLEDQSRLLLTRGIATQPTLRQYFGG